MPHLDHPLADTRLLIVEDEPLIALMLEDFAEVLGCKSFLSVATEKRALVAIGAFNPQLALLDPTLSEAGPNFLVADALVAASIPIIFCSGYEHELLPSRHRARDFLVKPFALDELKAAILKLQSAVAS